MEPLAFVGREKIQILRLLGEGGMGTVWLGRFQGGLVAVKMMLPALVDEPRALERFQREVRILGALHTPHAVRLVGWGDHDGQPYAVMESVEGVSLADRLEASGTPPHDLATEIVKKLLAAVREIHEQGVVHRDIKPANVMLSGGEADLKITVIDFGVAFSRAETSPLTGESQVTVGTGPYMSPEQALTGGAGSVHEDMWAIAVVAYECLVGRVPFGAPQFAASRAAVASGAFVPPSLVSDVPLSVDAWFRRTFAPNIQDRFSDVATMTRAWERATRGAGAPTRRTLPSWRPITRSRPRAVPTTRRSRAPAAEAPPQRDSGGVFATAAELASWVIFAASTLASSLTRAVPTAETSLRRWLTPARWKSGAHTREFPTPDGAIRRLRSSFM